MQLPVSGFEVQFRVPTGSDDMALVETGGNAVESGLTALSRLALLSGDAMLDLRGSGAESLWKGLSLTDFDFALLSLRRFLFGDRVVCVFRCSSSQCGNRMATEFSISALLDQIKPKTRAQAVPIPERDGWFKLHTVADEKLVFRLPTVQDQIDVIGRKDPDKLLAERCLDSTRPRARELMRVERAMEMMAPLVSRSLEGVCADCGQQLAMQLHVPTLVMGEMCAAALAVHDDVDAIAEAYHWDEAIILAMPQRRRCAYAETIRRHRGAAL